MRAILASLVLALPASAETTHGWAGGYSHITIRPTTAPGAVAEVIFADRTVHSDDDLTFSLTLDGLTVDVHALVGRGLTPDRVTITPPDGFIAVPPELDVAEEKDGVILLYRYLGF
jgi:hypothetical protein